MNIKNDAIKADSLLRREAARSTQSASKLKGIITKQSIAEDDAHVKLSARAQTDTPEFKKWFGDSKVVNEDGTPRIVYHGTNGGDFNVFDWGHTQRADAGRHAQ